MPQPSPPAHHGPADQAAHLRWATAAMAGDRQAFARLTRLHEERIFRLIWRRVGRREEAQDLTQDVFFKAWRGRGGLREPEKFSGWLTGIALNRVRDWHRMQRLRSFFFPPQPLDGQEPPDVPDDGGFGELQRQRFWGKVREFSVQLSPLEREVFFLVYLDAMRVTEVAMALSRSESTVKTLLARALAKFRKDSSFLAFLEGERT